ncbi:MAG: hypothetical protein LBN23_04340 [Paludibacter sp.]|jgi:hypothetical protein|nr:hypothetical protein [Paludibacter sp.]
MKKIVSTTLLLLAISMTNAQNEQKPNAFANFQEFINNTPSLSFEFQLKQRTTGDIFMLGGIANYQLKKITPKNQTQKVETEIWGVLVEDIVYINSFLYSEIKGYNKILEKGYYSYFIGEPARLLEQQRNLGIIGANDKVVAVCCQVGYVILPDGKIMLLTPKLLFELCKDNEQISEKIQQSHLIMEDVPQMFEILKEYNLSKKYN